MYLIDTNVISEIRKKSKANNGVQAFFDNVTKQKTHVFISAITIGELRRGVDMIQHRGDKAQARKLGLWLETIIGEYSDNILDFTESEAQVWGRLRVANYENALDKQIAATAITHGLILATRNSNDFIGTGVQLLTVEYFRIMTANVCS